MSFRVASKEAKKSCYKQHRLGAVVVKGGRILATGFNELRPSSVTKTPTLHAEASAILKLLKKRKLHDLFGADLYVTRYTRGGSIGLARPCVACMDLIRSVGISHVHYTTNTNATETMKV